MWKALEMDSDIRINKYLPIAIIYFAVNSFLLPLGLLYTTLLTPLFLVWLFKYHYLKYIWPFFFVLIPFAVIHFIHGVDVGYYLRSTLLLFSVYVFALAFYLFLQQCKTLRRIYNNLIVLNTFLLCIALFSLFIPFLKGFFWSEANITDNIEGVKRLKMLTYEPSFYSTLLIPIALYYYLKIAMKSLKDPMWFFVMLTVPMLLSLSFGVISGLLFALMITFLTNLSYFFPQKKLIFYLIVVSFLVIAGLGVLIVFFPNNLLFVRIENIFSGHDTSFKGRTSDSFYLAWKIASLKSIWFGVGPGQVKVLGAPILTKFYAEIFTVENTAIPNAVAETMATFGIVGVVLRLMLIAYLYFRTKVYGNYYQLSLFLFIFLYQCTGSYLPNTAEYVIWILAFSRGYFEEFNRKPTTQNNRIPFSEKSLT